MDKYFDALKPTREIVLEKYTKQDLEGHCKMYNRSMEEAIQYFIGYEESAQTTTEKQLRVLFTNLTRQFEYWRTIEPSVACDLFKVRGKTVMHRNTINAVVGTPGSNKSRLAHCYGASMLSSIKKYEALDIEYCPHPQRRAMFVLIDTEHSRDQVVDVRKRICKLAGLESCPDEFELISIKHEPDRVQAMKNIILYLEVKYKDYDKVVQIDTVSDLVGDVNDLASSYSLVTLLNQKVDSSDFTIISVIHEAIGAGGVKPRGHLGTELYNKSSTVFRMQGKPDAKKFKLQVMKMRSGEVPPAALVTFKPDVEGLTYLAEKSDDETSLQVGRKTSFSLSELAGVLQERLTVKTNKKDLIDSLSVEFSCSDKTVKNRMKELGNPFSVDNKLFRIHEEKSNIWLEPA